ncbi:MAG: type II toxin-antitoxin system PrlF family antitoxin [Deltaproteobacteria bacterium]|nr:type II toxin-antitoxin system PrlF family antitoxin [Deltaproteobacteria bacterium]MBW1815765.1 type II toxin-antitoxin system PrlF family antitoxin [Deltaproteobacteria bacterium]
MALATITTKGQVTIPKTVRDSLKLDTGDMIEFVVTKDGEALVRPISKKVDDVFGKLHKSGRKAVTVEAMDKAIARKMKRNAE